MASLKGLANPAIWKAAPPDLDAQARATAIHSLVKKGMLARLGRGGEYWLTDQGVQALDLRETAVETHTRFQSGRVAT